MNIKYILILIGFLSFSISLAQNSKDDDFGVLKADERNFTTYAKDTTANAVVLYEKGENYFEVIDYRIRVVKKYHVKIKIIKSDGFEHGNIEIPFYGTKESSEKVTEIKAFTHNGNSKTAVSQSKIFTEKINDRWSRKKFAFPNLKEGSIIEYRYKLVSPYFFNFSGWDFQSDIPKIYSEFNAKIPANYQYNRSIIGPLKLAVNDASIKKSCFHIDGYAKDADCEVLKYAMKDIPAFKAAEDFMLSSKNYKSRIDFEMSIHYRLDGSKQKYTQSWKDVDSEFKGDKDIGRQLTKKGFFEKNVPESLLTTGDELTKAKNIYTFIQDHYTWNEKYGIYRDIRVKDAFNKKTGSVGEINISLINLLNAAGIKTNLMLLSTRDNGLPKKVHPVMSDFNYVVAKTKVGDKEYLLDASDKYTPFGMLPFKCLNFEGRVMDFKNESYWHKIIPEKNNKLNVIAKLVFNKESGTFHGEINELNSGYMALNKKRLHDSYNEEDYLELLENNFPDTSIENYKLNEEKSNEKRTIEHYEIRSDKNYSSDVIFINPFLVKFFTKNPFLLEKRTYPIDFGYSRTYNYTANFKIPEGYTLGEIPESKQISFPDNQIGLMFISKVSGNKVSLTFKLSINNTHYTSEAYPGLKELFKHVTNIQNNSLIVLNKEK